MTSKLITAFLIRFEAFYSYILMLHFEEVNYFLIHFETKYLCFKLKRYNINEKEG
ncbi:hypothetical protein SD78_1213 [Bacillus badius]|nr:hypothetical protein SD78_1213 [Bacillus badius]